MASEFHRLPEFCMLPDEQLEALIGLRYELNDSGLDPRRHTFSVSGSEHYGFVGAGPGSLAYIVERGHEPREQYLVQIDVSYFSGEQFCGVNTRSWKGQEAFDADEAAAKEAAAKEAELVAARRADEKAEAMSGTPKCIELFQKLKRCSYKYDVFVRLFAAEPRVVLSLAVTDAANDVRVLSFTSLNGAEVYSMRLNQQRDLPDDLWSSLASASGAPMYALSVALPSGCVISAAATCPPRLEDLLAGGMDNDGDLVLKAVLTARANLCMAEENSDLPLDSIDWTQMTQIDAGSDLPSALDNALRSLDNALSNIRGLLSGDEIAQACATALEGAVPMVVNAGYRSRNVPSKRHWWVDSDFCAVTLGGQHEGTVLMVQLSNKDMS